MSRFRFKREEFIPQGKMKKEELEEEIRSFNEDAQEAMEYFEPSDEGAREIEKTEEYKKAILLFADFITEEMRNLGIDTKLSEQDENELLERVHILETREKHYANFFNGNTRNIEVYLTGDTLHDYASLLHEMLHLFSASRVYLHPEKLPKIRVGYSVGEKMEMFNEAVTEQLVNEILLKHRGEIEKILHIPAKEIQSYVEGNEVYVNIRKALKEMLRSQSELTRESIEDLWEEIKRNYFTGKLFFLRKFQKAYGYNIIEILAQLDQLLEKGEVARENLPRIFISRENFQRLTEKYKKKKNEH